MKNVLIVLGCLCSVHLFAQYSFDEVASRSSLISKVSTEHSTNNEELNFTKLTTDQCPIENGYGVSDCSLQELKRFMASMDYPAIAYEYDIQETCKISFTGNVEGRTNDITVSECSETLFGTAIKNHLAQFSWTPATKNGETQNMSVTFNMEFEISN